MALVRRVESVAARLIDCGLSIRTFYPWNTEPPYNGTREELLAGLEFAEEIADDAERAQAEAGQR